MSNKRKLPKPEPDKVVIGYLFEDEMKSSFVHCFLGLLGHDTETVGRIIGFVQRRGATGNLGDGRNQIVEDFLQTPAQWLWMVDTDMGFAPDTVERLLEAADPVERPVVGGLCFAQREHVSDGVGGWRPVAWPTVMDWNVVDGQGGFEVRWDYPRNTLTRCSATGSACVLIHRSVFERVREDYEDHQRENGLRRDGDPRWNSWYSRVTNPTTGELMGEDLSFCARLGRLEIPVHVHTGVQTTHQKNIWLQEEDYWIQRAVNGPVEKTQNTPREEWKAYRFAVVPTHNRPDRLAALVGSLAPQVNRIFVLDNASDPPTDEHSLQQVVWGGDYCDGRVVNDAHVYVLRDPEQPPNLSRFWNVLFDACQHDAEKHGRETWDVAVFNDDAVVPAGWYDTVSTALREHDTAVVAHTGTVALHREDLVTTVDYERHRRMCPWAFVVKGEAGLRSDESMRFWFFDDDFNRRAAQAGGVLGVPGPLIVNALATQSTFSNPVLLEQTERDRETFVAKWGGMP